MNKIVYIIDPQSVSSLAAYDRGMLEDIRDVEIHFFGNNMYNDKAFNSNVKFYPVFSYGNFSNPILKGLSYLWSNLIILAYAIRERPAVVHLQWIRQWHIDWPFISLLKKMGVKIVFTVHNILPRKRKKNTFGRFKKLYDISSILIAHTETTKKDLELQFRIPAGKIVVMPHGLIELKVTESELCESAEKLNDRYKFGNKIIFGALGVQCPYKGTDMLVNAWIETPELRDSHDLVLLIAGRPNGIEFPDNLPENVIIMPNLLNNPDFKYLLRRTDVIMMPYRTIEQSGVLLSLINEHKPYCCTKVGELARPFEFADVGWIIPEITPQAIADVLKSIVANPETIRSKAQNAEGWKALDEEYSWRKSNRILDKTYKELLNS